VVSAIQLGMKKIQGKKGNFYNIASGTYTTINDLAKLMILISGKNLDLKHTLSRDGDISHSVASITLSQKELGYSPKILLKQGLQKLLDEDKIKSQILVS
jgi:nucleoside-diphosphate-sugar epimerase